MPRTMGSFENPRGPASTGQSVTARIMRKRFGKANQVGSNRLKRKGLRLVVQIACCFAPSAGASPVVAPNQHLRAILPVRKTLYASTLNLVRISQPSSSRPYHRDNPMVTTSSGCAENNRRPLCYFYRLLLWAASLGCFSRAALFAGRWL